jgi:hypothetical protein
VRKKWTDNVLEMTNQMKDVKIAEHHKSGSTVLSSLNSEISAETKHIAVSQSSNDGEQCDLGLASRQPEAFAKYCRPADSFRQDASTQFSPDVSDDGTDPMPVCMVSLFCSE